MNQTLKRTIERAKKDQCPADVIKRAIAKAEGGASGAYTETSYEGFGPGRTSFIVDCVTDNVNRTFSDVRAAFTKNGGQLGQSTKYQFDHRSVVTFDNATEDEVLEVLLNNDCDVIEVEEEDGVITVYSEPSNHHNVSQVLTQNFPNSEFLENEITWIPQSKITLSEEDQAKFDRLMSVLADIEDIQDIYHNCEMNTEE